MPYIEKDRRDEAQFLPRTPGELNFAITQLLIFYVSEKGMSYTHAQDAMSACQCAALEFYRRVVALYEDEKRAENGDVYQLLLEPK